MFDASNPEDRLRKKMQRYDSNVAKIQQILDTDNWDGLLRPDYDGLNALAFALVGPPGQEISSSYFSFSNMIIKHLSGPLTTPLSLRL